MSNVAISVEGLGKKYRIGSGPAEPYGSLRDSLMRGIKAPLRRLRQGGQGSATREHWALKDVSFEVKHGEAVGIIGRNGAGKSTLLKVLSRITEPTTGQAVVHGRVGSLLEVGTGFHPELTGRENIYLNGAVMGMNRADIKKHFDEIVDFAGVEKYLDTPVKRYSSGMYMRLAFAVAAHLEPEVLVVDEVLAVGDAEFQKKCLGKMGEVAGQGRTVLFVSHNMTVLPQLCSQSALLQDGNVACFGPSAEIISRYHAQLLPSQNSTDSRRTTGLSLLETEEMRVVSIFVSQEGEQNGPIFTHLPIDYSITYVLREEVGRGLRIGFDLLNTDDVVLFRSFSDDEPVEPGSPSQPGVYTVRCTIPANMLRSGRYSLVPIAGIHNQRWLFRDQWRFILDILQVAGTNSGYADSRPGVIMPLLEWTTAYESGDRWDTIAEGS